MGPPEGKTVLDGVKALEEELKARLAEAERRARLIADTAASKAAEAVRAKEAEAANLRCRLDMKNGAQTEAGPVDILPGFTPDKTLVEKLADEVFRSIIRL